MASYEKRSGKWLARVNLNSTRVAKSFGTKAQAKAWAAIIETEIRQGEYKHATRHTVADAFRKYAETVSPRKRGVRWELIRLNAWRDLPFANIKISDVKTAMLADWRDLRLKTVKPSTVNREFNLLSSVFEYARREWQWIKINPVHDVGRPKNPSHRDRAFTDDEITAILTALGYSHDVVYTRQQIVGCAFLFALETAMRREEITGLTWDRIDIDGLHVKLAMTKNGDPRNVPLSKKAVAILERLRDFEMPFNVNKDVLSSLFRRACMTASVDRATFHDARRTALTRMALSGKLSPYEVAEIAGHRNLKMALVYFKTDIKNIAEKLN